jgi:glycosyltransferase involved in cell wall biosynthesis
VIPLYNAERYVKGCLDSVASQTCDRFECLCIDDGSTDRTAAIIGDYAARDDRFSLYQQANAGCSAARNRGIRLSAAPYLAFLDADDVLHPQAFEILLHLIESREADVSSFQYGRVPNTFELAEPARYVVGEVPVTVDTAPFRSFLSKRDKRESAAVWTRLYRRRSIEGIAFPEGVHFAEDLVFVTKVMHRIRSLAATPLTLLFYRDHPASATNRPLSERPLRSYAQAARELHAYFGGQPLTRQEAGRVLVFLSTLVYKTSVVPFLRDERLREDAALLELARAQWLELLASGAVGLSGLSLRKRLAGWCFAKNRLALGRRLDALVAKRGR